MDKQKYTDYFQKNFSGCKNCGSKELAGTGEEIVGAISLDMRDDKSAIVKINEPMPLIPVVCKNCGFVHFFSKIAIDKIIS